LIQVANIRTYVRSGTECAEVYIGRQCGGFSESPLANKFKIGRDGNREQVIAKYKIWLWKQYQKEDSKARAELDRLCALIKQGVDIMLMCWCVPKACHGTIIRDCIVWMLKQGYYSRTGDLSGG